MAGFFGNFQQLRISKRGKNGEKQKKKGKGETKLMCVQPFSSDMHLVLSVHHQMVYLQDENLKSFDRETVALVHCFFVFGGVVFG
jgi:hypothetical protein